MPFNMLLGFCKNYTCVIVNACHELILIRARQDYNCLVRNPVSEPEVELFKIQWPHIVVTKSINYQYCERLKNGLSEHEFC